MQTITLTRSELKSFIAISKFLDDAPQETPTVFTLQESTPSVVENNRDLVNALDLELDQKEAELEAKDNEIENLKSQLATTNDTPSEEETTTTSASNEDTNDNGFEANIDKAKMMVVEDEEEDSTEKRTWTNHNEKGLTVAEKTFFSKFKGKLINNDAQMAKVGAVLPVVLEKGDTIPNFVEVQGQSNTVHIKCAILRLRGYKSTHELVENEDGTKVDKYTIESKEGEILNNKAGNITSWVYEKDGFYCDKQISVSYKNFGEYMRMVDIWDKIKNNKEIAK